MIHKNSPCPIPALAVSAVVVRGTAAIIGFSVIDGAAAKIGAKMREIGSSRTSAQIHGLRETQVRVILTKVLGDEFATTEELTAMDDRAIIELIQQDVPGFLLHGAEWTIEREGVDVDWDPRAENACRGCGLCCMNIHTPPFLPPYGEDPFWQALPQHLKAQLQFWVGSPRWEWLERNAPEDCPCLWLDLETGRCRHYEFRPNECRRLAVGSKNCLTWRAQYGLPVPLVEVH